MQLNVDVGEETVIGTGSDGDLLRVGSCCYYDWLIVVKGDITAVGNEGELGSRVSLYY